MMKSSFKKIRSGLQRKETWSRTLKEKHQFIVRWGDGLCQGRVLQVLPKGLQVILKPIPSTDELLPPQSAGKVRQSEGHEQVEVLGFLNFEREKYYFMAFFAFSGPTATLTATPLGPEGAVNSPSGSAGDAEITGLLLWTEELYQLDRRAHHRVQLGDAWSLSADILQVAHSRVALKARVLDISGQGLRLVMEPAVIEYGLEVETVLEGRIQVTPEKTLPFAATVRHVKLQPSGQVEVGCALLDQQGNLVYRFTSLSLLLQKKLLQGVHSF